jgi:aryl carrier-like protein
VKSALIGGQGKSQASLLVEPYTYPKSAEEEDQYIKDIWPSVLQANHSCPAHGRIMKGFVMLAKPEKPISRAGKGTVQRHAALKLYESEFKQLYDRAQTTPKREAVPAAVLQDNPRNPAAQSLTTEDIERRIEKAVTKALPGMLEAAVQKAFSKMLLGLQSVAPAQPPAADSAQDIRAIIYNELAENLDINDISDDTNLFKAGLNSLQAQGLVNVLNGHLAKSKPDAEQVNVKTLYEKPTVRKIVSLFEV